MEDYTKEDVLKALMPLISKSRKRILVDQRSYLIAVLAYKFMMTEHGIAATIKIKRDRINYNKKLALQYHTDKAYKQNVYVYAQMFPYDFDVFEPKSISNRLKRVQLDMSTRTYNKLKAAGSILGHKDVRVTIKLFLEKSLKLWEE
jgi:hypothetical protein